MEKNQEPELGISHSVKLGLKKVLTIQEEIQGILFTVSDQPI